MSRLIHFLARLYPPSWRQRYGAEFAALLEDVRPDGRTAANVFAGALAMHIRNWKSWKILAASAVFGAAVMASLFAAIPNSYVSSAVLKVGSEGSRQDTVDAIQRIAMNVESRVGLVKLITTYNLYRSERSRKPLEDVIEEMKKRITITPAGPDATAFAIGFTYKDPRAAQQVTRGLVSGFIDENARQSRPSEPAQGINLQILDPASLPETSMRRTPELVGSGIACFLLMFGGLSVWRSVSSRRYAQAGASISSPGFPAGSAAASARSPWKILGAIVLLIAVAALSFQLATASYESTAVIRVVPPASPQALASLAQSVEDRFPLTRIITTYNLYPGERASLLSGDVVEEMKKHIRIEPVPRGSKSVAGILIRFSYPDHYLAQKVTDELTSQFIKASSAGNSTASLSVVDPASLPEPSLFAVEPRFGVGLFLGLLLGLILAVLASLFRRSRAPV